MIRLSKLADYGIVLLTYFARANSDDDAVLTARELAERSSVPLPTVGKILKSLCRGGLLVSQRGIKGGYRLAAAPKDISVVDIIRVLDGPIALTECSAMAPGLCEMEAVCPVRSNWQIINRTVFEALKGLTLADMQTPGQPAQALPQTDPNSNHKRAALTLIRSP